VSGGGGGKGGEMTQTLYAHMNKIKILKKNNPNNKWADELNSSQKNK
jgi:hypothetical protein